MTFSIVTVKSLLLYVLEGFLYVERKNYSNKTIDAGCVVRVF
jgi:hypothetical protein